VLIEYYLALVALGATSVAPTIISGHKVKSECMVLAEKLNRSVVELRTPQNRAIGLEVVCLKVTRVLI
jgi:hypothetical protein